jgi:hypothetical protein
MARIVFVMYARQPMAIFVKPFNPNGPGDKLSWRKPTTVPDRMVHSRLSFDIVRYNTATNGRSRRRRGK